MLQTLHIKNFVLIDEMTVDFSPKFNVFTGETGAGKSMIIDGLSIILGARASREKIRNEQEFALIEASFRIKENAQAQSVLREMDMAYSDVVMIKRVIHADKPSETFLNGSKVTVEKATLLVSTLVDIIGQHSTQILLNRDHHLELLDGYGDAAHRQLLIDMEQAYQQWYQLYQELQSMTMDEESRHREMDLLTYQQKEIDSFGLEEFSEEEFEETLARVENIADIKRAYENLSYALTGDELSPGLSSTLDEVVRECHHATEYDSTFKELVSRVESVAIELQDVASELHRENASLVVDAETLSQLQERREALYTLKSKYGHSIDTIRQFYQQLVDRLQFLETYEKHYESLQKRVDVAYAEAIGVAKKLTRSREQLAEIVETGLVHEMQQLDLPHTQFMILREPGSLQRTGQDDVRFLISTNVGEKLRPVEMVASGGELSRMTLAMNLLKHQSHTGFTIIYDEIDSGISGHAAKVVGQALKKLSHHLQVLTITHLPQIAALGDSHYRVEKEILEGRTVSSLTQLDREGRLEELAHMIGGGVALESMMESMKSLIDQD